MTKGSNGRANGREPVLVVLQLSGGNDFMNTVVPYGDPLYYDFRQTVGIPESELLHIDRSWVFTRRSRKSRTCGTPGTWR